MLQAQVHTAIPSDGIMARNSLGSKQLPHPPVTGRSSAAIPRSSPRVGAALGQASCFEISVNDDAAAAGAGTATGGAAASVAGRAVASAAGHVAGGAAGRVVARGAGRAAAGAAGRVVARG